MTPLDEIMHNASLIIGGLIACKFWKDKPGASNNIVCKVRTLPKNRLEFQGICETDIETYGVNIDFDFNWSMLSENDLKILEEKITEFSNSILNENFTVYQNTETERKIEIKCDFTKMMENLKPFIKEIVNKQVRKIIEELENDKRLLQ